MKARRRSLKPKPISKWEEPQKEALAFEFRSSGGNVSKTAKTLGVSRNLVLRKLRRFGLYDK